jgi:hypothetical protein
MRLALTVCTFLLSCTASALATEARQTNGQSEEIRTLESIAARKSSGPPIFEFKSAQKTLIVLGTVPELPRSLEIDLSPLEHRVAKSEVVVSAPGLIVGDNISLLRGLTLWGGIRRNQRNSDGQVLQDVLPPNTYAAWTKVKAAYIGDESSTEHLRPMYAAYALYKGAVRSAGFRPNSDVWSAIENSARKSRIQVVDARLRLTVRNPGDAVNQFNVSQNDDVQCLDRTMSQLDQFAEQTRALGEAWVDGDVARISELLGTDGPMSYCWSRLTNQAIARQQGIPDLSKKIQDAWLSAIQNAFRDHDVVFTTLPVRDVLGDGELKGALQRSGFATVPSVSSE